MTDQNFAPCPKSPGGEFECCWHDDLTESAELGQGFVEVCCHCAGVRSKMPISKAFRPHGPHVPDLQLVSIFRRHVEVNARAVGLWKEMRTAAQERDERHHHKN